MVPLPSSLISRFGSCALASSAGHIRKSSKPICLRSGSGIGRDALGTGHPSGLAIRIAHDFAERKHILFAIVAGREPQFGLARFQPSRGGIESQFGLLASCL